MRSWKFVAVAAILVMSALVALAAAAQQPSPALARALADPARGDDRALDARRKPADILAFAGVRAGQKIGELIPGSGYFTRIFSLAVGPQGRVYAVWPQPYANVSHPDPEKLEALAKTAGFGNIEVLIQPAKVFSAPQPLDIVFTSQNYHDYPDKFMGPTDPALLNGAVFRALKPGGVWLIVDHAAQPGSGLRDTDTLHRIDPATVKAQVLAAGFVFAGQLDVLRNPADDHTLAVFDPKLRGHTDQFIFKFVKPR